LLYASNWPVSDKGGSYADQFQIVSEFFQTKGPDACEAFFWRNAQRVYRTVRR
jgi:predicted TIM-barrel fold metal-dependent hydrolase